MSAPFALWLLALFALAAHALLALGAPLAPWLLPACAAGALALARPQRPRLGPVGVAGLLLGFAVIAWGACATDARVWDGFVAWGATAKWLAVDGTLAQPVFTESAAYLPSRGYPLLQPALLQQTTALLGPLGGRLLFPCLWLSMLLTLAAALRQRGVGPRAADLAVAALALLPAMTEGREGAADSGYADLLVAVLLTHAGASLLAARALPFALACALLPLAKNEGVVHAAILAFVAAAHGHRRIAVAGGCGGAAALLLWAPLQARLQAAGGAPTAWGWLPLLAVPVAAAVVGDRLRAARWRLPLLVGVPVIGALLLATAQMPALGGALQIVKPLDVAWPELPRIALRVLWEAVHPLKVGFTFVLPVAAALALRARGERLGDDGMLPRAIGLGLLAIAAFVAMGPRHLLDAFLRTGVDRYVAQWVGVGWLAAGALWARLAPTTPATAR